MSSLQAQPLSADRAFNWVFLIEVLVVGILATFFLFYFNRLFATAVSYLIRLYTWKFYGAYIDITALQISLLGGRVFFKKIRYHAHNVTLHVYEGHVTWRYWIRAVKEAEVFLNEDAAPIRKDRSSSPSTSDEKSSSSGTGNEKTEKSGPRSRSVGREERATAKPKKELPCRISVKVAGVEAFIYNRSPVYDAVVEATSGKAGQAAQDQEKSESLPTTSTFHSHESQASPTLPKRATTYNTTDSTATSADKPDIPFFLRIFPIKVECKRAAAALGNENTKNIIIAKTDRGGGTFDAGHAGPLDIWRILMSFEIENVVVQMKPNRDFKEQQLDQAQRVLREMELEDPRPQGHTRRIWHRLCAACTRVSQLFQKPRSDNESLRTASVKSRSMAGAGHAPLDQLPGQQQWHGLMRYLDDGGVNEHDEWSPVEYAKASELVNVPKVTMRFYFDMPGPVPEVWADSDTFRESAYGDDINGAVPPAYGMDLGVHGGAVVYGPWADRQRLNLQPIFVPATYVDATPAKPLKPGELRVWTVFQIKVTVEDDVVMRIPTREESKDARWKGRADKANPSDPGQHIETNKDNSKHCRKHHRRKSKKTTTAVDARPYGWLDVTVKKDSVVNFNMDMYPRPTGYRNTLDLDVKGVEMSSSVNHGLLWRSGPVTLDADISQPCPWNSIRKWPFNVVVNDLELFILRDHLFLIIDIVNDWASGAPSEFYTFVPYIYDLDLTFNGFCMYLNVNDANIINDPADFDRNDFLTLEGKLHAVLGIPMEHYRPKRNQISFDVLASDMKMRMISPPKSTFHAFVEDKVMATLPKLTLNGSFNGNQEARVGNVDVLRMDIVGTGLTLKAFGFFVRQLVSVKENYFGDYMHFKTLEEFQSADEDLQKANAKTSSFPKPTSVNELDVVLCIVAEEATVLFPTNLYSANEFVRAELPRADLDLRIVSYYLDMGLQLSPVSFLTGSSPDDDEDSPLTTESGTQFFCSHVELNGHRSFGLPPNEEAYVSEWDIDIGKITGEMSSRFIRDLANAARAITFTISDAENALPVISPAVVLDASFVNVRTDIVRLWMHVGKDALLLDLEPVKVDVSAWASELFSQRVSVLAPLITFACVDAQSASRHRNRHRHKKPVRTYAFLQTGVSLDVIGRRAHFMIESKKQQAHFKLHDQRTNRFPFLIRQNITSNVNEEDELAFEAPAMPYPLPPTPLVRFGERVQRKCVNSSSKSDKSGRSLLSKSSCSSLSASVKGERLGMRSASKPGITTSFSGDTDMSGITASFHSFAGSSRSSSRSSHRHFTNGLLPSDKERARLGLPASTMAYSSPYAEPYFPLELVEPDETNVPLFPLGTFAGAASRTSSSSELIEDPDVDTDAEHTTVMIKMVPGIRAYVEPRVAITASKLIRKVTPKHPEEVMDEFQMHVLGTIQAQNAAKEAQDNILEIQASLPAAHLRAVVMNETDDQIADQVDLNLRGLENVVRVRTQLHRDSGPEQFLAVHALLEELVVQLKDETIGSPNNSPAVRLSVDDVLVWLALADTNAFHVSLKDTDIAVAGGQARYMTHLALKLIPLIKDVQSRFEETSENNTRRLQILVHALTQTGEQVGDPPFIGRLLYVLRVVPTHLRNTDSWKVLSRFRYTLMHLPSEARTKLEASCKVPSVHCPGDSIRKGLESWTQSRNWDVPYINQTLAFKTLFSPEELKEKSPVARKDTTATFRSESLRVAIEHMKGNSDIIFQETSFGLENSPPTRPEGLMLLEENKRIKTSMQMHTNTIALALDWGLFYIAQDVISLSDKIENVKAQLKSHGHKPTAQRLEDSLARHDFHAVMSTTTGSISVRSANLRHVSRADGLKMSLIGTTQGSDEYGQCESLILNIDEAVTELHGLESRIWQTVITSPSIYIDHLEPALGVATPPMIMLAISYNDLQISIMEQIPVILQIIDSIVQEEVAMGQRLAETVQSNRQLHGQAPESAIAEKSLAKTIAGRAQQPKLHLAVLAGQLELEVSLLSTLSYQLKGTAASVRVAPSLSKDKIFSIDFDVGRQKHAFLNTSEDDRHTQGLLDVPPINGHIGLELGNEETSISVASTIERVEVDAGAIQGLVGVISRSEVQNIITAAKGHVEDIKLHIAKIFPEGQTAKRIADPKRQQIVFDTRFALLGIRVSARTPRTIGHATAEVEFGIGPLHATASNKAMPKEIIPEVRAHIQDIGARLTIYDRGKTIPCGSATLTVNLDFKNLAGEHGAVMRELKVSSHGPELNAYPATAATVIDVINCLQDRIKHLDLSKEVDYLRRMRDERRQTVVQKISGDDGWSEDPELPFSPEDFLAIKTTIELADIQACWIVDQSFAANRNARVDDLIFSIASIEFTTRSGNEARLTIKDVMLQLAKRKHVRESRSLNSGLLPEIGFCVGYWKVDKRRHMTFKATGKPLDLRLETRFILPVNALQKSIELAIEDAKKGTATWESTPTSTGAPRSSTSIFDNNHIASLLVEADFAGAQVYMQGSGVRDRTLSTIAAASQQKYGAQHGRYGQFAADGERMHTKLTAPGIAFKLEYNSSEHQPTVNGELMIDASSNMLLPNVVPLVLEVSHSVKELVRNQKTDEAPPKQVRQPETVKTPQKFFDTGDDSIIDVTPAKIFGKTKVDLGFRIAKQEFGLSCQPIARVDAKVSLEDFYVTMNTIDSDEHGHFFATSAVLTGLKAQVKHVYSREPTFSYDMESIVLSAMNNKHLSGQSGISAILNVNPTKLVVNGKQFQDLLLFREIWLPPEIRHAAAAASGSATAAPAATRTDEYLVQKYQTVAAAAAFPWNATVSIKKLAVDLDLGQSIGKSSFTITNLWASQTKTSNWEQNMCIGMDEMAVNSTGRMSGFIQLADFGVRTSIKWPEGDTQSTMQNTPLIQASIGFEKLRAKAAFDYQAFAFGDIEGFDFLMYNVRDAYGKADRLVAVLDCEKAYLFATSTSAAQAVSLYQAFDRLIQEKQSAYVQSLRDIEKHLRRESTTVPTRFGPQIPDSPVLEKKDKGSPISLHTDVVVTIGAICVGCYPSTFFDSQMLKLEAHNIQARFAAGLERGKVTSGLGMTLGQLQVGLSSVRRITAVPKALEVTVDEVINSALHSKGGTILRVPKVVASMQSWQAPQSNEVDYIFKSLFDGKIDVGWNLSRINFIKGMWTSGSKALAQRLDKSLPKSAVKIRAGPDPEQPSPTTSSDGKDEPQQEKITAEINLPQSRYEYHAIEPSVIETPQLRDMGEATPPLEWIGLHRDRLPNVVHQVVMVALLEVCKEVGEAYGKILGSS